MLVAPVYDKNEPHKVVDCLKKACDDMRCRIHNRQLLGSNHLSTSECVKDADYTLFIFYSGHGIEGGHWCPLVTFNEIGEQVFDRKHVLEHDVIDDHLANIRRCTNANINKPTCDVACM